MDHRLRLDPSDVEILTTLVRRELLGPARHTPGDVLALAELYLRLKRPRRGRKFIMTSELQGKDAIRQWLKMVDRWAIKGAVDGG